MKHAGKPGKRNGPTGFRTPSTFLHRKALSNAFTKAVTRQMQREKKTFPPKHP